MITTRKTRASLTLVLVIAALARLGYWQYVHGPLRGGDSQQFIRWSGLISQGSFTEPMTYPLHQMYSVFLIPMHVLPISQSTYLLGLHLFLSVATVWFLFLSGQILVAGSYGLLIGVLAALNPDFVFWTPYILTETQFLFALSLFLVSFLTLLGRPTIAHAAFYAATAIFLFLSRPVAFPIVGLSLAVVVAKVSAARWGRRKATALLAGGFAGLLLSASIVATLWPSVPASVLRTPTIVQSLWLSTRVSTSNIDEILSRQESALPSGTTDEQMWRYKLNYAQNFIAEHPARYLQMAMTRFLAFWFPWIFARWSFFHKGLDAVLSLGLVGGALVPLFTTIRNRSMFVSVMALAMSLAMLTAFSQIDSDGRYRLPAELLLLPLAPAGWRLLFEKWQPSRTSHTSATT